MSSTPAHRRGAAVHETVLDATLALLAERGYGFTVDEVAARAGVHKTTVYRRWDTKPTLVAAAVQRLADQDVPEVNTGDVIADLVATAVQVARALRQPAGGNALRAALAAAGADAELREVAGAFLSGRYSTGARLVASAQEQGLISAEHDPTLVWQAVVNPLHINAALNGDLGDQTARALARLVLG
jgi:AcrR family transcriptional regulator